MFYMFFVPQYLYSEWSSGFPYFVQFKLEFCNKQLIEHYPFLKLELTLEYFGTWLWLTQKKSCMHVYNKHGGHSGLHRLFNEQVQGNYSHKLVVAPSGVFITVQCWTSVSLSSDPVAFTKFSFYMLFLFI